MTQADLRDTFKKASQECTSTVLVYPNPLSPAPSASSAMKNPENTEEDSDDLKPAGEGDDTKWNTPVLRCAAQV